MNEPTIAGTTMQPEPELHKKALDPKGVLQKNMKPVMYLGAAALVILAAVWTFSKSRAASGRFPTPRSVFAP
jgi:type IV secretion system protein TrbI